MTYTLDDLAEYRPGLARGLRQLLDFEGDVEEAFGLVFAVDAARYGAVDRAPLCPGGDRRAVTNANRREYVDAYVRHALDGSVARQFEPFKRGFYTVCGNGGSSGGALSLFRPEEIELLVRGSAGVSDSAPLDVAALRAVAVYDGWRQKGAGGTNTNTNTNTNLNTTEQQGDNDDDADADADQEEEEEEPTIRWFWESFQTAPPRDQRRLLAFITGSDRLPALGAASLAIRVACLGDECGRFPTARTCFNSVGLWRATDHDRDRFVGMLWRAVWESEGFGLK
jgi:E3 ubiquitin-protein ligase HECTD2